MRLSRSIIRLHLIISILFGVFIGGIFPFFLQFFGIQLANNNLKLPLFLTCSIAGVLIGFISFLINKMTIIRIIAVINKKLYQFSQENFDLSQTIEVDSQDLIGELVNSFNRFVLRLNNMLIKTKKISTSMHENSMEFNTNIRQTTEVLKNIFENLENVKSLGTTQHQHIQEAQKGFSGFSENADFLSSHSKELIDEYKDLSQYIQNQRNLTQEYFQQINSFNKMLEDENGQDNDEISGDKTMGRNLFGLSMQFANESTRSIEAQSQRFSHIKKILTEIEDIAESTHLLSINASIEAARAGESGRGFTIVALQIRNLATNSGNLTSEIREQIDAILSITQNASSQFVGLRDQLVSQVESTSNGIKKLTHYISQINKVSESIQTSQQKFKKKLEILSDSLIKYNTAEESIHKNINELASGTDLLYKNINKITVNSGEIEKITENFLEQSKAAEIQIQEFIINMKGYQTSIEPILVEGE